MKKIIAIFTFVTLIPFSQAFALSCPCGLATLESVVGIRLASGSTCPTGTTKINLFESIADVPECIEGLCVPSSYYDPFCIFYSTGGEDSTGYYNFEPPCTNAS